MKHIVSLYEFINEGVNNTSEILIPKLSDIDHTRVIKWLNDKFSSDQYDIKKSGSGYVIDTRKLSKQDYEDLKNYLKSQSYIKESVNEGKSYQDIAKELVEIAAYYTDVDLTSDMTNAMKCDSQKKVSVFYSDLKELMKDEEPGKHKEFEKEASRYLAKNGIMESVNEDVENYMFFGNLETIKRHVEMLLALNQQQVDEILKNGHDWAEDHITTSKDDIEEVCNFLQNEMKTPGTGVVPENEDMNEGEFYRLPKKTIQNDLYAVQKNLSALYDRLKAGNDFDPAELKNIITKLENISKQWKKFKSAEEVKGTAYESEKIDEAMVQVAGKDKPAGAQVLATVIIEHLMKRDFLKPGAQNVKKELIADLQKVIMENTF